MAAPGAEAAPHHAKAKHRIKCDCSMEHERKRVWRNDSVKFVWRSNDWYLHRPSTPEERAETADLNRQAQTFSLPAYPAPMMDEADIREQGYQQALREYRAARERYDWQMREYTEWMQNSHAHQYHKSREQYFSAPIAPVPPVAPHYIPSPPPYQDERLAPWHGYNPGPSNGY